MAKNEAEEVTDQKKEDTYTSGAALPLVSVKWATPQQ